MATTSDIKNGLCLRHQGGLYQVIEFLHKKTARGAGQCLDQDEEPGERQDH